MAVYSTGTITVAPGAYTVSGTGTAWVAAKVRPGWLVLSDSGVVGVVREVVAAATLRLVRPYAGAALSGAPYTIVPTQGLTDDLVEGVNALLGDFRGVFDLVGAFAAIYDTLADLQAETRGYDRFTVGDVVYAGRLPFVVAPEGTTGDGIVTTAGPLVLRDSPAVGTGLQGPPGAKGDDGEPGPPGPPGEAPDLPSFRTVVTADDPLPAPSFDAAENRWTIYVPAPASGGGSANRAPTASPQTAAMTVPAS